MRSAVIPHFFPSFLPSRRTCIRSSRLTSTRHFQILRILTMTEHTAFVIIDHFDLISRLWVTTPAITTMIYGLVYRLLNPLGSLGSKWAAGKAVRAGRRHHHR